MSDSVRRPVYVFDGFRLDAQRRVLFGPDGELVALTPRLLDALLYFVEHAGELMTKDQLLQAIWPRVVVEEHNLNKTVSELRRALGEKPGEHKFIVTTPGRGYRFVAEVSVAPSPPAAPHASPAVSTPVAPFPAAQVDPASPRGSPTRRRGAAVLGGVAVVGAAAAILALVPPSPEPALRVTPWSVEKGQQWFPAWSPDGASTAFTIFGRQTRPNELVVRDLSEPIPRSIAPRPTDAPGTVVRWTTTGKILFFDATGLWSLSPVGGEAELVVPLDYRRLGIPAWARMADVNGDGTTLATLVRNEDSVAVLTATPPNAALQKYEPAPFAGASILAGPYLRFSPSGRQLLASFYAAGRGFEVWLLPFPATANDPPRRVLENLPFAGDGIEFSWLPDDRHVVLTAVMDTPDLKRQLYLVDTRTGRWRTLVQSLNNPGVPVVSPDGSKIIVGDGLADIDIVTLDLRSLAPRTISPTDRAEILPAWSAGTNAMVYATNRSGSFEIWLHQEPQPDRPLVTARDFSTPTLFLFAPAISSDGGRVVFHRVAAEGDDSRLWLAAVAGGFPEPLTNEEMTERAGSWSPDDQWYVYWSTPRGGGQQTLKKVRTTGRAAPEVLFDDLQLATNPPAPIWSPDGEWILTTHNGLTLVRTDGSQEARNIGNESMPCAFGATDPVLYCIRGNPTMQLGDYALVELDLDGREMRSRSLPPGLRPLTPLEPGIRLSPTPDRLGITYSVGSVSQTLWLIEGLDGIRLP